MHNKSWMILLKFDLFTYHFGLAKILVEKNAKAGKVVSLETKLHTCFRHLQGRII